MLNLENVFDEGFYLSQHPDAAAAIQNGSFASAIDHYRAVGFSQGYSPSPLLNENYYLDNNPDIAAAVERGEFTSGVQHYLNFGQLEGRDPSALFNEEFYRRENPGVAEAMLHPQRFANDPLTGETVMASGLEHYLKYGQAEGREIYSRVVPLWDEAAQQAVRNTNPGPTIASRAYGMVHTGMFDAWAAYDPEAIGTQLGDTLQRPLEENTTLNKSEAMSYAAYGILVDLFPDQIELFNGVMLELGYDPSLASTDTNTPEGIGTVSADALLDFRRNDGSNQLNGYEDTTDYQPVNSPDEVADLNRWQPLRQPLEDPEGTVQKFLTPQWGEVIPFALESGDEFRPPAPPEADTALFQQRTEEILNISANLTDEQKIIAEFWEDGAGTSFPPGTWMTFGQFVSERDANSLDEDIKMFFPLGNAVFDAGIAAWEAKVFYDYVRPITAVRELFDGQQVLAWTPEGTQLIDGSEWEPYQRTETPTPPFAEYVSGHSTFSAAAAEILKQATGSDEFGGSFTAASGSSVLEPGVTPTEELTLSWSTFSGAADESGISRLYGGIHFTEGDLEGRILGREVGEEVWEEAQSFINGSN
ncbi:MAG: vanadium-dependent haloperoxidase [Cyanobacteriota bacterium]|nr:vanadium-dependent haloperoxidase [Cyanobacteriota bacterium]